MAKRELKATRRRKRKKIQKPSTAKMALWYIFTSCTIVQIYSMVAMWHFADLTPLVTLIGATVGEAISYCSYSLKSTKENTTGGIVYDMAMQEANKQEACQEEPEAGAQG